ncbi:MAG: hypothetical protein MK207_04945 [Saprospiraceae bacterium]|nr:hypothetical protein [Saprospiraceae bacterium]
MTILKKIGCFFLVTMMISCNSGEINEKNEIVLEMKIDYSPDSSFRMEYQMDKAKGIKHGSYKEYDDIGLLIESTYKDGKIDGIEKHYFSGTKNLDAEFTYVQGVLNGDFKYYFEDNGKVKQKGSYINDKIEGMLISYYSDGTLKEEVMHVGGLTKGTFKEYNENGTLKAEGDFTNKGELEGLEHGLLKLYDENGGLDKKMVCKEGQCCTIWTLEEGDVKATSNLCKEIISGQFE